MSNVIIDLKNIDITFTQKRRTIQAVKDVSIQIEKGDIYGKSCKIYWREIT